jgi:TolB-like protein/DNA-binding SARP family transcriptional activator
VTSVQLQLFGGACLRRDDAPLVGPAAQRHPLALLALLAMAADRGMSRDRVIAYLWPQADTARARHLLANTVYELRRAIGDQALLTAGDTLRLDHGLVRCEVREFEEALASGAREAAVAHYAGPFLDGFFLPGAPEFERWVEGERERLARANASALEGLSEEREAAADPDGAVRWWRRLAAQDPLSSRVAMRLMRALARGGDRVGAIRHARAHQRRLREELDLEPDPAVTGLAERLQGESASAPVAPDGAVAGERTTGTAPARMVPPEAALPARAPPAGRRRWLPIGAIAVVVLVAMAVARGAVERAPPGDPPIGVLAVLPLENLSGDPEQDYFADGMTDALITELARRGDFGVISRTSVMRYRRPGRSLPEIARELSVDAVVEGTVVWEGDRIRISAQLIRTATDRHVWAESFERDVRDVLALQHELAVTIAAAVRLHTSGAPAVPAVPAAAAPEVDPRAYALYLKALYLWNDDAVGNQQLTIDYFLRALAADSTFAPAYAGLAEVYVHLDEWTNLPRPERRPRVLARENLRRSLALDSTLAEAHTSLAHLFMHEHEWAAAEDEYRRAIELNPNYAYARVLFAFHLAALGRFDEAVAEARRALQLDPLSARTNSFAGFTLYCAGRYDEAIRQWQRTLELYPGDGLDFALVKAFVAQGRPREGLAWVERGGEGTSSSPVDFGRAYALAAVGRSGEARAIVGSAERSSGNDRSDPLSVAMIYARLGDREPAFQWLEAAMEQDDAWAMFLGVEPAFAPLRDDPRFTALLRRMKLRVPGPVAHP